MKWSLSTLLFFMIPTAVFAFTCASQTGNATTISGNDPLKGQQFTPASACVIDTVTVSINSVTGTPTGESMQIQTDNAGQPSGSTVDSCSNGTPAGTGFRTFTCSGTVTLNASTPYWFVTGYTSFMTDYPTYDAQIGSGQPTLQIFNGATWSTDGAGRAFYYDVEGHTPSAPPVMGTSSASELIYATASSTIALIAFAWPIFEGALGILIAFFLVMLFIAAFWSVGKRLTRF